MISEAAIYGIEQHGLGWKHGGPVMKQFEQILSDLNDNGFNNIDDVRGFVLAVSNIHAAITRWLKTAPKEVVEEFTDDISGRVHDEMEELSYYTDIPKQIKNIDASGDPNGYLEEVCNCLNAIYDLFDYHRVIVR